MPKIRFDFYDKTAIIFTIALMATWIITRLIS